MSEKGFRSAVSLHKDEGFKELEKEAPQRAEFTSRRYERAYVPRRRPDILVVTATDLARQREESAEALHTIDIAYRDISEGSDGQITQRAFILPSGEEKILSSDDFILVDLLMAAHQQGDKRGVDLDTLANAVQNRKGDKAYLGERMVALKRIFDAYDPTHPQGVFQVVRRHPHTTPAGEARRIRRFAKEVKFIKQG